MARQVSLAVEETGISAEHMRSTGVAEEVLELDAPDGIVVHVTISPPIQLQKPMARTPISIHLVQRRLSIEEREFVCFSGSKRCDLFLYVCVDKSRT